MLDVINHDAVRLLTFNRPEVRNAFDTPMYKAVASALDDARTDDTVKVVVLTGCDGSFSAGQDLNEMARIAEALDAGGTFDSGFPYLLDALTAFDKPLIAAVNGVAVGVGFTLLPHCDLVLLGRSARCKVPFAPLGVPPEAASSYLFPLHLGPQRAAEVLFTGRWLSAEEAVAAGLGLRLVDDDALLDDARTLATEIAQHPLGALRAIKGALLAARADAVAAARAHEEAAFTTLLSGFTRP